MYSYNNAYEFYIPSFGADNIFCANIEKVVALCAHVLGVGSSVGVLLIMRCLSFSARSSIDSGSKSLCGGSKLGISPTLAAKNVV